MQARTNSQVPRVRRHAVLQRPRCPMDWVLLMKASLDPRSLPPCIGLVRTPRPNFAIWSFLPPSVLQGQPIRFPGGPRRCCRPRAATAAVRKHGTCERAEFLHRLQEIRMRTRTLCVLARVESLVAYDRVGLGPLLWGGGGGVSGTSGRWVGLVAEGAWCVSRGGSCGGRRGCEGRYGRVRAASSCCATRCLDALGLQAVYGF